MKNRTDSPPGSLFPKTYYRKSYKRFFSLEYYVKKPEQMRSRHKKKKIRSRKFLRRYFPRERVEETINKRKNNSGVIIYPQQISWDYTRFQRAHQLMIEFSRMNYVCFFCDISSFAAQKTIPLDFIEVLPSLYLSPSIEVLKDIHRPILFIHIPLRLELIREFRQPIVVYDYLDELDVHGYGDQILENHNRLLQTADAVFASASLLHQQIVQKRPDALLIPNAVRPEDFDTARIHEEPPEDLRCVLARGRPIIGYYGALAPWVDFDLIKYAANTCPELSFVIIGYEFGGVKARSVLGDLENLFLLGPKPYRLIKEYLHYFDVATIPFTESRVTQSVSPVKLFEYMAGNKPIVSTNLFECSKYDTVLVSCSYDGYVKNLYRALELRSDQDYLKKVKEHAHNNSWVRRAEDMNRTISGLTLGRTIR